MTPDFKIYISTLDEDRLIPYTIASLLQVFPPEQIEVIDLGSKDQTLARIPKDVKTHQVDLPATDVGAFFTELKNEYSRRQEWVLWVDGDEIYPASSLLKVKAWVEGAQAGDHDHAGERLYWRILKDNDGQWSCSNEYLSAGPKLFNSNYRGFRRAWPKEVSYRFDKRTPSVRHKSEFNDIWFWHGVLLNRSSRGEQTGRRKKRQHKEANYNNFMTWSELTAPPWETQYKSDLRPDWVVVNKERGGDVSRWTGSLEQ